MSTNVSTAKQVEIFGAVYHVRGDKDHEYLQELAEAVEQAAVASMDEAAE